MAANKGMVAGSHKRNEFVMIHHEGDAPAAVRVPSPPMPSSLLLILFATASCRARACVGGSGPRRWFRCNARVPTNYVSSAGMLVDLPRFSSSLRR